MIKNILFDFDGVILDSMPVRDFGFREIFESFDNVLVEKLIEYNNINGGLSRYVKIRYFYEDLLNTNITEDQILELAEKFSFIMKQELINKKYLIDDTVDFIKKNFEKYNLHIVSGSDEKELRFLCKELAINDYFKSIHGSPVNKNELVKNVLKDNNYNDYETILIGDSINDYEASKVNNLDFYGFNNNELENISKTYIENFNNFIFFNYGIGEISHSKENKTFYNIKSLQDNIDYLLFFDSRGMTINEDGYENSHLKKVIQKLENDGKTYIVISRPKNIMIFATLLNFLQLNYNLKFKNLITNIGFVDFTPKKNIFIEDMKQQIRHLYNEDIKIHELSQYILSDGTNPLLYTLEYSNNYIGYIIQQIKDFKFTKVFFINTPEIAKEIKIERIRHKDFFDNLSVTNVALDNIFSGDLMNILIDIKDSFKKDELLYTYDAVHFSRLGHELVCEKINLCIDMQLGLN